MRHDLLSQWPHYPQPAEVDGWTPLSDLSSDPEAVFSALEALDTEFSLPVLENSAGALCLNPSFLPDVRRILENAQSVQK